MSKFKASNGVRLTQGLFYEFNKPDAPYTLRDEDYTSRKGNTYKSMGALYTECSSEYEAAIQLVGSWSHWNKLKKEKWFTEGYETTLGLKYRGLNDWKEEQDLRKKAEAESVLVQEAKEGNVTAAKFIYEQQGKQVKGGRPEKKVPKTKTSNVEQLWKDVKR